MNIYIYMSFKWIWNLKMKPKIYYYLLLKIAKRLLNKHIENLKKLLNPKWSNQEKHFISIHYFTINEIGC